MAYILDNYTALSLSHSGAVNVERGASRALQAYVHPQPLTPSPWGSLLGPRQK